MILVDSSTWIEYFKGNPSTLPLNRLIDTNAVCVNELIISELMPSVIVRNEKYLSELLWSLAKTKLSIDWDGITQMQVANIRNGINKVGIPDLIIAQNALQRNIELYAYDKHFGLMKNVHGLKLYER